MHLRPESPPARRRSARHAVGPAVARAVPAGAVRALALAAAALALLPALAAAQPPLRVTTLVEDLDGAVGGVAVDRLGHVYVADFGDKVWRVKPWGEVEVLARGLYGTSGNTLDAEGALLQSSFHGDYLSRIHRDGTVERVASGLEGPVGVTLGAEGEIYVTNCRGNWIARVTEGGGDGGDGAADVAEHARSDLFSCPNGITRDPQGNLYVLNFNDTRILEIDGDGGVEVFATLPGTGGGHLVWTPRGIYATTFRGHRLHNVAPDGTVTTVAGSGRFAVEDGTGEAASFASPNGIAWDPVRGFLYVNDYPVPWLERRTTRPRSALRRIELPGLTATLTTALAEGGADALEAAYRRYETGAVGHTEAEMNRLGYILLQQGETAGARRVFELNAEAYPGSANVWDSLAEFHAVAGDRERAVELYRKVLEIDPLNENARAKLEELGAEP